jgi:threonine synthase
VIVDSTAQLDRLASLTFIDATDNRAHCHKTHMISGLRPLLAETDPRGVTAGTCGNYGLALALAAHELDCPAVICIPASYDGAQVEAIRATGATVVLHGETYEDAVEHSAFLARRDGLLDCNPGGPCDGLLLTGLADYLVERLRELPERPDHFWVPLGNGSTTIAALSAVRELGWDCQINAVTSIGNNSVLRSWGSGRHDRMPATDLRETTTNEPLCNWLALHGDELFAVARGQVSVYGVTDVELEDAVEYLNDAAPVRYTPSGAAGVAGSRREAQIGMRHAVLLTARLAEQTD